MGISTISPKWLASRESSPFRHKQEFVDHPSSPAPNLTRDRVRQLACRCGPKLRRGFRNQGQEVQFSNSIENAISSFAMNDLMFPNFLSRLTALKSTVQSIKKA